MIKVIEKTLSYVNQNNLTRNLFLFLVAFGMFSFEWWVGALVFLMLGILNAEKLFERKMNQVKEAFGSLSVALLHVVVLWGAYQLADFILVTSLGLPGDDFSVSKAVITLLIYFPLGLTVVLATCFFAKIDENDSTNYMFSLNMIQAVSIGMAVVSIVLFVANIWKPMQPHITGMVKNMVYILDYKYYPTLDYVDQDEYVVFHENGRMSVANKLDGNVIINIKKVD
ncbi:hypothetical protein [Vibrio rotiferianus]|uniref:hypothetical protein n=1 Tax=Vibrio rotiferianus TaxID=190895 RepID=UPI003980A460